MSNGVFLYRKCFCFGDSETIKFYIHRDYFKRMFEEFFFFESFKSEPYSTVIIFYGRRLATKNLILKFDLIRKCTLT